MKQALRVFLVYFFIIGILGCNDEEEEPIEEIIEEVEQPAELEEGMYFPPVGSDDWETKDVVSLGWDQVSLEDAINFARDEETYSLMILHKGRIVVEYYWEDTDRSTEHELESVSKSMMAVVIGMLQADNVLKIDEPVSSYIGDGWSKASLDKERLITVKHLLTMTSGLDLELNYLGDAGSIWYYSHQAFTLLYRVVAEVTKMNTLDFIEENLFSKIGMKNHTWQHINLSANARDMARFGILILNQAKWKNEQILKDEGYFSSMINTSQPLQEAYGYLWWLNGKASYFNDSTVVDGPIYASMPAKTWLAMGRGDQRLEIVPDLNLIVIRQGRPTHLPAYGPGSFDQEFWSRLMRAIDPGVPGS